MTWLAQRGVGFDCASSREVKAVLDLPLGRQEKAACKEILFANPCKKEQDIWSANLKGVTTTVVDSHAEIEKLRRLNWQGSSLLRLKVEDKGSAMPFSAKFGLDTQEVENLALFSELKGQSLSGISFHVGSGCGDLQQYQEAILQAIDALRVLNRNGHPAATTIDIGGGFVPETFPAAAEIIQKTQEKYPSLTFVAEPGRFFAQTSHDLFVKVIGKKPGPKGGFRYTIDESLYGQFSCIPFDHARPKWIRIREPGQEVRAKKPAVLYGRTCDSVDFIAAAAEAEELEEGDWLWFPYMGAYTTVTSTEFNGFPKPPSLILETHNPLQLPDPQDFEKSLWPSGCKYVSAVAVPQMA
jgi:ornithine decarboxylase